MVFESFTLIYIIVLYNTHFTKTNYATIATPYHKSLGANYILMPTNKFSFDISILT
jgi:hypothetical protein